MTTPRQYPSVSTLIPKERLPSSLAIVGESTDTLLHRLRYRALVVERSPDNVTASYSIILVVKDLSLDLLGSGLKLVFFPSADPADPDLEIPIGFEYRWRILRYLPEFQTLSFEGTARAFFDVFLELVEITEEEFLAGIVDCFISDPAPYQALVDQLKTWQQVDDDSGQSSTPLSGLTLGNLPVGYTEIEYVVEQIKALQGDVDVFVAAFEALVNDANDLDESIERLVILFQRWLGSITRDDIEDFLLPQFSLGVKPVRMAIEVPESVLVRVDPNNQPLAGPWRLTFTAGGVRYDSRTGFEIDIDKATVVSPKAMVPRLGLTLQFDDIEIDLSRTTNIAKAAAEGRPVDFMGVSIGNAVIGLPQKWFAENQSSAGAATLGIVGRNLLIGTGGFSGTLRLEALSAGKPKPDGAQPSDGTTELEFILGRKPDAGGVRKGFKVGFSFFDMTFRQNKLLETGIKGSLTVPKFSAKPLGIELLVQDDGDFEVTASKPGGHDFTFPGVFTFKATKVTVGKDEKRIFLRTSGDLVFEPGTILGELLKKPIHLEKLIIHSDGSPEIEGGSVPLPESVVLPIGPAKIAITAIHFGSHMQELGGAMREYRYWGFDGGISVNPGGVDARGDGIKFYYTVDNDLNVNPPRKPHSFLRIEGIGIDLVIPGTASKDKAVLLLKGYLSLKDPVYQGSLQFELPQVKVAGGAYMKYDTSYPAWAVDVNLQLPKPLPLGATGLGVVGFRGLFGLRYVAAKEAIVPALPAGSSWGEYYRAPQPKKGVGIDKFIKPDKTVGSSNPFSVGVGVDLVTQSDDGRAFAAQLFLLVSVPNLIMLEGRGDILNDHRLGPDDDPPYYAYLALTPESIELGVGVDYLLPKPTGNVLNLHAVLEAAFYFKNASAWYINVGTKAKPATARVIEMFDAYAYLMLSASGIETGTGVSYDFNKTYGPVSIAAHAYLDLWAYISFQRKQAGGGIALGGHVDVKVFKFGLYIELAAALTAEMPEPFRIAGYAKVCVKVQLKVKTWEKCCQIDFVWDKNSNVNLTPVAVMTEPVDAPAAIAIHMVSGTTYPVEFSTTATATAPPVVPVDSYIDVKFTKPVTPLAATIPKIGGFTSPAQGATEKLPPRYGSRVVTHSYALKDVKLEFLDKTNPSNPTWKPYHPYVALEEGASVTAAVHAQLAAMPLALWQKQDPGYSQIRFLAQTPFSWMGAATGFVPEQMGVTAESTYCVARDRTPRCLTWTSPAVFTPGADYDREGVLHRVEGDRSEALALVHPRLSPVSLAIALAGTALFRFPEPTVRCKLTLLTTAPSVTLHWQRRVNPHPSSAGGLVQAPWVETRFENVGPPWVVSRHDLGVPVVYDDPANPIDRILMTTPSPNVQLIANYEEGIARREQAWVRANDEERPSIAEEIRVWKARLAQERGRTCLPIGLDEDIPTRSDRREAPAALPPEGFPAGWECGTFVHELCWLSEADYAYNQSIPGIAAIAADFSKMRAAVEKTIAPIWRPRETYRITLTVADTVTGPVMGGSTSTTSVPRDYYVHFQTKGPLGHFPGTSIPLPDKVIDAATTSTSMDDGRLELPERSLKFYLDMQRSLPDPSGNLLYAKPVYYMNVVLRLFMDKPHAYHFFTDWPGVAGKRHYALQLAVKDPAEAAPSSPPPPNHQQAIVPAALLGTQTWAADPTPKITPEIKTVNDFRDPLHDGSEHATACLSIGGDRIKPFSKNLEVKIDLEPNKLYTAVVLHRCVDLNETAEVHRYPFKTSLYPSFASHIASYKLKDDANNERAAVFSIDHALASTSAEPQKLAAALAVVGRAASAATVAHPDFFDRLIYGLLEIAPLPPARSVEFNFLTNSLSGHTYALWIRSPEALFDPRLPPDPSTPEIQLLTPAGNAAIQVLLSKDRWQAFVMTAALPFPTQAIKIKFTNRVWNGTAYTPESATTDTFSRP